jgi:hypothetical protein
MINNYIFGAQVRQQCVSGIPEGPRFWQDAGLTRSRPICCAFLIQAVLLAYDITNYESFQNLEDWYSIYQKLCCGSLILLHAIIGTA